MTKAYFKNIEEVLVSKLKVSVSEIKIAVAWLNNKNIYDLLLQKTDKISITLLISNDVNNYNNGIDFQQFIDSGGMLHMHDNKKLMHNKYVVIDNKIVITGSYNFTFGAEFLNYENLVVIENDIELIGSYLKNFDLLISTSKKITNFDQEINKQEDISKNIFINKLTIEDHDLLKFSDYQSLTKDDIHLVIKTLIEEINLDRTQTTARAILILIEDKLPNITDQRLLKLAYYILMMNDEKQLASKCFSRIHNGSKWKDIAELKVKLRLGDKFLYSL